MKIKENWTKESINNLKKNEILWKKFLQMLYKFIISDKDIVKEILEDFKDSVIEAIREMDETAVVDWLNQEGINLKYDSRNNIFWITTLEHFNYKKAKELILEKLNIPITDENIEKLETWLEKFGYWDLIVDSIKADFKEFYEENDLGEIFYDLNWEYKIGFSEENLEITNVLEIDQTALDKIVFEKILDYDTFEEKAENLIIRALNTTIHYINIELDEAPLKIFTDFLKELSELFKEEEKEEIDNYLDEIIYLDENSEEFEILKQLQKDFIAWIKDFPEWFSDIIVANYEDELRTYIEEGEEEEEMEEEEEE
jgi:hypothetical protein